MQGHSSSSVRCLNGDLSSGAAPVRPPNVRDVDAVRPAFGGSRRGCDRIVQYGSERPPVPDGEANRTGRSAASCGEAVARKKMTDCVAVPSLIGEAEVPLGYTPRSRRQSQRRRKATP